MTIGAQQAPHSYSLLELATAKGGLRLPMLSNDDRDALNLTSDSTEANGLFIYNTDIGCVEFWSGGNWIDLCSATPSDSIVNSITLSSAANTNAQTVCGSTAITTIRYSTTGATGATVTGLPAGVTGSWNAGVVTISGRPTASGSYTYIVILTGGSGNGMATGTITVNMVPQLGVIHGNAVVEKGATNLNYYVTPVSASVATYTWIVPPAVGIIKGGQGTNTITVDASSTASGPDPAGTISVTAINNCGTGQASTIDVTVGCGAYVSSTTDWREFMCYNLGVTNYSANPVKPSPDIYGARYKWGTGLVALSAADDQNPENDAGFDADWTTSAYGGTSPIGVEDWNMDTANPCPSGYHVPTVSEWSGVVTHNTVSRTGTWINDGNYTTGIYFGNSLFLPANGFRLWNNGGLVYRGYNGYYWLSTTTGVGTAGYCTIFDSSNVNPYNGITRDYGFSVRCIATK